MRDAISSRMAAMAGDCAGEKKIQIAHRTNCHHRETAWYCSRDE